MKKGIQKSYLVAKGTQMSYLLLKVVQMAYLLTNASKGKKETKKWQKAYLLTYLLTNVAYFKTMPFAAGNKKQT